MGIVYKIVFPDQSVYFGQTICRLSTRIAAHRTAARQGSTSPLHQKVRELGLDLDWVINLASFDDEEMLSALEAEYIDCAKVNSPEYLLNTNSKTKVNRAGHQSASFRQKYSDMMKGRNAGENNFNSKLTEEDIKQIFILSSQGERRDAIAKIYGVSVDYLSDVFAGKSWKHIDRESLPKPKKYNQVKRKPIRRGVNSPRAKLDEEKVILILKRAASGENRTQIAESFGIKRQLVQAIITGTAWPQVERPEGLNPKIRTVRPISSQEQEEIVQRIDAGETPYRVSLDLNRSANVVDRFYKRIKGLTPNPKPDTAAQQ